MPRLLFEKSGRAAWISHLDLMRLFQRAFKRAGLKLKHTQGFNPRPSVSIALPLSVGVESHCELLDFELEDEVCSLDQIKERLNSVLVDGVAVKEVYGQGRKTGEISLLKCEIILHYDNSVPQNAQQAIIQLFHSDSIVLPKKTKKGIQDQDIIPMIRKIDVSMKGKNSVVLGALIFCQNPTLNPSQLVAAIEAFLPACKPSRSVCRRIEIFDFKETVFR